MGILSRIKAAAGSVVSVDDDLDFQSSQRAKNLAAPESPNDAFRDADYTPENDVHDRYTDNEAANAAPVQSVNGQTGNVSVSSPNNTGNTSTGGTTQTVVFNKNYQINGDTGVQRQTQSASFTRQRVDFYNTEFVYNYSSTVAIQYVQFRDNGSNVSPPTFADEAVVRVQNLTQFNTDVDVKVLAGGSPVASHSHSI